MATMPRDCRNAHVIAAVLRRKLRGAAPAHAAPPGWGFRFIEEETTSPVADQIVTIVNDWLVKGRAHSSIGVVTTADLRNALVHCPCLATDPKDGEEAV